VTQPLLVPFRRQFLLAPSPVNAPNGWRRIPLYDGRCLHVEPSLPVAVARHHAQTAVLLGVAIDAEESLATESVLVRDLVCKARSLDRSLSATAGWAGRWLLVLDSLDGGCTLVPDPCALLQVRFATVTGSVWAASSSKLLARYVDLVPDLDPDLQAFVLDPAFRQSESAWVGDRTMYVDCRRLLPNQYLSLPTGSTTRFCRHLGQGSGSVDAVAEQAAGLLTATLTGLSKRKNLRLAVTAGWDSRALLAASLSAGLHNDIRYFVDRMGVLTDRHADIRVPRALARSHGFALNIDDSGRDLPTWFVNAAGAFVDEFRVLPKQRFIFANRNWPANDVTVNGNCAEICRGYYASHIYAGTLPPRGPASWPQFLARVLHADYADFAERELQAWIEELGWPTESDPYELLDMLYWEQRMGNWGAHYPAEEDVVGIEEISPFNCRALMEMLGSVQVRRRIGFARNELWSALCETMAPGITRQPVNPPDWTLRGARDLCRRSVSRLRAPGVIE
jgi:hypothetical protein